MLAAIDWNIVLMDATMGGIVGAVVGGIGSLFMFLTRKLDKTKRSEAEQAEHARQYDSIIAVVAVVCCVVFVPILRSRVNRITPATTSSNRTPSAVIEDYGRYRDKSPIRVVPDREATSVVSVVSDRDLLLLEQTDQIPCRVGETWGVRVRFSDVPVGRPYTVRKEVHHPVILNPDQSFRKTDTSEQQVPPGASPAPFFGWYFLKNYEHELKTGEWTLVVFVDDVEVARKVFNVMIPRQ